MISLFIDTSNANVSISVVKDKKILSYVEESIPNMHSALATKFVKDALDIARIDANEVDNIMVVSGPGSFTGVRIGVTIAKTYGYLIKKEITPVSSLKMLAISAKYDGAVMSLIPANKSNYYVAIYDNNLNEVVKEKFMDKEQVLVLCKKYNPYVVGISQSIIGTYKINKQNLDILAIVDYYSDKPKVNYHKIVPNYLKLPQALEAKK